MTNRTLQKQLFTLSCVLIGIGVILGAFGAHGLKKLVSDEDVQVFKTGVMYQFIHAFGLLVLALSLRRIKENIAKTVYAFFAIGITLFSGSLYVLVLTRAIGASEGLRWLGFLTPLGGLCFIAGWFVLGIKGYKPIERS